MKVLHLINSLAVGGAETLLVESLNHFAVAAPSDDHFLATVYDGGPLLSRFGRQGDRYLDLGLSRFNLPAALLRLRRFLRRQQIEVVHSHLFEAGLIARLAAPAGVAVVSTYHTGFHNPASIEYSRGRLLADRLTYRRFHYLVFVSDAVRREIAMGLPATERWLVVKNFISKEFHAAYHPPADGPLRLVSVGNLREQKNHLLAIEALAALKDHPITLDIFGGGPLAGILQARIDQTGARVVIHSGVRVGSDLLGRYHAFLMTSRHEGMSLALLEAMTTGLPSILNDISHLAETAEDSAWYFQRDSAADLARVLARLEGDRGALGALSARAATLAKQYSIERYTGELVTLYRRALGR